MKHRSGWAQNGEVMLRQAEITDHFDLVADWTKRHGNVRILLGEFGAYNKAPQESRGLWTKFIREQAEAAVEAVFQPPPPPEPAPATPEELMQQATGGMPGEQSMLPPESQDMVGEAPSGRPDLATMLAGIDAKGQPTLSGGVMRSRVI